MNQPAQARVLVVDDRNEQLVTLRAMLGDLADEVVCVPSGREALRKLLDPNEFAVMLLDIHMPSMDGFELAELVRQHRVHRNTPIIFLTASGDDVAENRCYALGAVDYMLSPIVPTVLRTKVRVLVELHRKTIQTRLQAEALRRRATQLHALAYTSAAIHSAGPVDAIVAATARAARDVVGAEAAMVVAAPAGDGLPAHRSVSCDGRGDGYERAFEPLSRLVRQRGSGVRMSAAELARSAEWTDEATPQRLRGYLGAPLRWPDGQYLGIVQLTGKAGGDFDADDEAVVAQLAHLASIAVQNRTLGDAREANRVKDEFLGNLSHELRNPLNALAGWVSMLGSAAADGPVRERAVASIERNVRALTRLVDDLLDVSRIATNRMVLETRPTSLDRVVRDVIESVRPTASAKSISIECDWAAAGCEVLGDPHRLGQVAWNLLTNALKFTVPGGHVWVSVRRTEQSAVLTVRDDGEGIAPEFLPFVFDRFRQARPSPHADAGGLGLGLAIVRSIVELHGGSVRAQSEGTGKGATLEVTLPLLATAPLLDGYHLLVVERDEAARSSLERAFGSLGARVTAVASADEALPALAASPPPDAVVAAPDALSTNAMRRVCERAAKAALPVVPLAEASQVAQAVRQAVPRPSALA